MKLKISEIKEKADVGDKFDFPAIVKKVYPMKKKDMPYAVGIQNVVVKDDTDEITVGMFMKTEEDEFARDIEGKKVQVSGEYSTFQKNGKLYKNISKGKILIESENEKPKAKTELLPLSTAEMSDTELKIELIKLGIDFAKEFYSEAERKGGVISTGDIVEIAEYFEKHYVRPEKPKDKVAEAVNKAETLRKQKDSENPPAENAEKESLIESINNLAEEKNAYDMIENILKGQKAESLEELEMPKLKAIYNSLEKTNNEVPF